MKKINMQPGDVFASRNPQSLGRLINFVQKIRAKDNSSEYGHTGIIVKPDGTTVEAVFSICAQNIYTDYKGSKILIARPKIMSPEVFEKGFNEIKGHIGATYPYYRLLWHALGLGKHLHFFKTPVCSELTQKFLISCGVKTITGKNYWGINPDDLVDEWRVSAHYDIVFEGVVE